MSEYPGADEFDEGDGEKAEKMEEQTSSDRGFIEESGVEPNDDESGDGDDSGR